MMIKVIILFYILWNHLIIVSFSFGLRRTTLQRHNSFGFIQTTIQKSFLSLTRLHDAESSELNYKPILYSFYDWIKKESLSTLIPQDSFINVLNEIKSNEVSIENVEKQYEFYFDKLIKYLINEKRSIKEIIGEELTTKLLKSVESVDLYEPTVVRSFLQAPVFESMLGAILYEGIFEFLQKVDILGNIINKLPIIGPIRVAIVKEFKSSLDKTVGNQIKLFLSSFNKVAVTRMTDFILSPSNRIALAKANKNIASSVLSRSISSLLPLENKNTVEKLKNDFKAAIKELSTDDINNIANYLYTRVGDKQISELVNINIDQFLELSPTGKATLDKNIIRFLNTNEGNAFKKDLISFINNI